MFRDVIRATNIHATFESESYLCPSCFKSLPAYKESCRIKSIAAKDKIIVGASERSTNLWKNREYKKKMRVNSVKLSKSIQFAEKCSKSIVSKFTEDSVYVKKVKAARKKYWDNPEYRKSHSYSTEEFIQRAQNVHGDIYDYTNTLYSKSSDTVAIVCYKHGEFIQRPSHHLSYENGCPRCSLENYDSKPQIVLSKYIESLGFEVLVSDKTALAPSKMDVDIYVPSRQFALEYHGSYWHSYNKKETHLQKTKHHRKATSAENNNITLYQFYDLEVVNSLPIVQSMIMNALHLSAKIGARSCEFAKLDSGCGPDFFSMNHISNNRNASKYFGLIYNGEVVCAASFSKHKDGIELIRFATKLGHTVVGGLSKLMSHVCRILKPSYIFSYADRRFTNATPCYELVNFKHVGITKPGYMYWKNNKLFSRQKFQKHKLNSLLPVFDPQLTESENMFRNGYRRIWDAGHHRFIRVNC